MADVFVSYRHEDRARVVPVVRLLEQAGLSIWWDQSLLAGEQFTEVIDRELHSSRCVVVAWSVTSIHSSWVHDEAGRGRDRGVLVPFSLDGTAPPLGFGQYQTPDLRGWTGDVDDPRVRQLVAGAARVAGMDVAAPMPPASRPAKKPRKARPALVGAAGLTVMALVGVLLATSRPAPAYAVSSTSVPSNATSMTLSPDGHAGYVVHSNTGTISVIDLRTREIVGTIGGVGAGALAMAVSPEGRTGYVTHYGSSQVSVVDLSARRRAGGVDVGAGQWDVELGPDGRQAYTADRGSGLLSVIDTASGSLIASVRTSNDPSDSPTGLAVAPDGRRVYATNRGAGTVAVVDTARNAIVETIDVQSGPNDIAISPDGHLAYVTNEGSNTISVIDLSDDAVTSTLTVGVAPITVAFTPDGKRALVVNRGSMTVSVIDTATGELVHTVTIGRDPGSISVSADGGTAYVTGGDSNQFFAITL